MSDNVIPFPYERLVISEPTDQEVLLDEIVEQSIEVAEQAMELEKQSQILLDQALKILSAMKELEIEDERGVPE
jgi:hypothetical protein